MDAAAGGFSLRQVEKLVGLSRAFIQTLIEQGVVRPAGAEPEPPRFSLQDVVVLRTARALRDARVPHRLVVQALKNVQESLAADEHLASVRLHAEGRAIETTEGGVRRDVLSGQMLLPLEASLLAPADHNAGPAQAFTGTHGPAPLRPSAPPGPGASTTPRLRAPGRRAPPDPLDEARQAFQQALRLEATDAAAAEAAYRRAVALDPCLSVAYVNLGAMLCESRRCREAITLYDAALAHCGDTPLIHFNRATALEDVGRPAQAVEAYERALALDPRLADAHYNLGVLMERMGDAQSSLRHFSAYRRLHREGVT